MRHNGKDTGIAGSFQALAREPRSLDFSPFAESLVLVADGEEVVFWDIRNFSRKLYGLKFAGVAAAEFCLSRGDFVVLSRENEIRILDLKLSRGDEGGEQNGGTVG